MVYSDLLAPKDVIHITDEDTISPETFINAIKSFKEKAPGVCGITKK